MTNSVVRFMERPLRLTELVLVMLGAWTVIGVVTASYVGAQAMGRLDAACAPHGMVWMHHGEWFPPAGDAKLASVSCLAADGRAESFPFDAAAR